MTDQNSEKKPDYIVETRKPVPSKGAAGRFATKRYDYGVLNIEETSLLEIAGAPLKVLRASVILRVFCGDYVNTDERLALFDQFTPGLDLTLRELTHGIYNDNGKPLNIMVHGKPARMSAYICDPSVKDGRTEFTEKFTMTDLLQAASGDDRLDRITRRGRAPLTGQRVDKHTVGSGVDADKVDMRSEFRGWVFASKPGRPAVDYEKGTASFNSLGDVGYAVYLPLSTIRLMANLYFKLEPRWRSQIEEEHDIFEARKKDQALPRRLQLSAGRQAPKARAPKPEVKAAEKTEATPETKPEGGKTARKRNRRNKSEAKAPDEKKADTGDGGEPAGAPVAEA